MWTSLFDDIGLAKDFLRKPGQGEFVRSAASDGLKDATSGVLLDPMMKRRAPKRRLVATRRESQ